VALVMDVMITTLL